MSVRSAIETLAGLAIVVLSLAPSDGAGAERGVRRRW